MKILQIAPPWFPVPPTKYGGTERIVAALTDGLVAKGHDVTLHASGGSRTRATLQTVYDVPPSAQLGDAVTELPHVLAAYRDRHRFDLIHDHTTIGPAIGAVLDGPPIVHTVHNPWTPQARRLYSELADRIHLVAISHDHARHAHGIPLAGVVPNGIDPADYRTGRGEGGYLAFVGRACEDKGPEVALAVARRLGRPLRMAIKVNQPEEERFWERVLRPALRGVDVDVTVNATHRQKVALLAEAEVVLMPLQWDEPFGLVMVEANACGRPVVAYARGAAPEVIEQGKSGFLVEPDDFDGFCAAVARAARLDPDGCREHVLRRFSAHRMVDGYLGVYDRVLPRREEPTFVVRRPGSAPLGHMASAGHAASRVGPSG